MDRVNSCTDIVRQTLHEIPGLMTSRSLLLVRQWSKQKGMFYLATTSIASSRFPEPEGVVTYELFLFFWFLKMKIVFFLKFPTKPVKNSEKSIFVRLTKLLHKCNAILKIFSYVWSLGVYLLYHVCIGSIYPFVVEICIHREWYSSQTKSTPRKWRSCGFLQ